MTLKYAVKTTLGQEHPTLLEAVFPLLSLVFEVKEPFPFVEFKNITLVLIIWLNYK